MSTISCSIFIGTYLNNIKKHSIDLVQKKMVEGERVYLSLEYHNPPASEVLDHVNGVMKEISPNSSIDLTELTLAEIRTFIKFKNLPHGRRIQLTNCLLF